MNQNNNLKIKGKHISFFSQEDQSFISLTDMARFKNVEDPRYVIQNWMKTRYTIEFLGLWEIMNNSDFKRVEFDTFKEEAGSNSFVLTPQKWINTTNAIGIVSKSGRYGGTYAHKDIAFEFASWISAEFKLYLIKEFQRLKYDESERAALEWNAQKVLAQVGEMDEQERDIIPPLVTQERLNKKYDKEADVLNVALYGMTEEEWKKKYPNKKGSIRDHFHVSQLACLAGLENLNMELIKQGLPQGERLKKLNEVAITQMNSLLEGNKLKEIE